MQAGRQVGRHRQVAMWDPCDDRSCTNAASQEVEDPFWVAGDEVDTLATHMTAVSVLLIPGYLSLRGLASEIHLVDFLGRLLVCVHSICTSVHVCSRVTARVFVLHTTM